MYYNTMATKNRKSIRLGRERVQLIIIIIIVIIYCRYCFSVSHAFALA